jgi:hypothetical protein
VLAVVVVVAQVQELTPFMDIKVAVAVEVVVVLGIKIIFL